MSLQIDLVEIARRGLNYLIANPDPERDYLPLFGGKIPEKGLPYLERFCCDYGDGNGRFIEALEYCHTMTGFSGTRGYTEKVEEALLRNLLACFEDDGLLYSPETPWSRHEALGWFQRAALIGLSTLFRRTGDKKIKARLAQLVDGLHRIAIREDGHAFLMYNWRDGAWVTGGDEDRHHFVMVQSLVACHEATGNEQALELAVDIAKGCAYSAHRSFGDDGAWIFGAGESDRDRAARTDFTREDEGFSIEPAMAYLVGEGHVHSRTAAIWGMIGAGKLSGDETMVEIARKAFEYLDKNWGSDFGWFAENAVIAGREVSEMCTLADVVGFLIDLADLGHTQYWNQIERYARNHLVESQFNNGPEIREAVGESLEQALPDAPDELRVYRDVLARLDGGFAGPIYPDDLFSYYFKSRYNPQATRTLDISGCCSPSGIRTAYLVWNRIFDVLPDGIRVNLNISKSTDDAEVRSWRDDEGRVDVTLKKKGGTVRIKLPQWEKGKGVKLMVAGTSRSFEVVNGYLECPDVRPGEKVTLEYDLPRRKTRDNVGGIDYEITWKGDSITSLVNTTDYVALLPRYQRR